MLALLLLALTPNTFALKGGVPNSPQGKGNPHPVPNKKNATCVIENVTYITENITQFIENIENVYENITYITCENVTKVENVTCTVVIEVDQTEVLEQLELMNQQLEKNNKMLGNVAAVGIVLVVCAMALLVMYGIDLYRRERR